MNDNSAPCNVLMIHPRFHAESFWNYAEACEMVGARYPAPPLGLITVAALLPAAWTIRLVDRNTEELREDDFAWADMVMMGSMINQQPDAIDLIEQAHRHGKPVVVGGPDPTSSPHVYDSADFKVLGEAEGIIGEFVDAWANGQRSGVFTAPKFQIDVRQTPIPRFDLLKLESYLYIGVQFSRGCPFTCEFCDIIELYGRVPRTKTSAQVLAELDTLYSLGYRGHVDYVDDNLVGNKKIVKAFLAELVAWQEARGFPFEFSTEASINLAEDSELLALMRQANFFIVFIGVESPDPDTLIATKKRQNTRRDLVDSIHKIYSYGIGVTAGFIVGFDSEKQSVAGAMADFIEAAAIPVSMVGLLYALPNTQFTRRLEREGRLHLGHDVMPETNGGDQCAIGLNFDTLRPLRDVLDDYRRVLLRIYDPLAYAQRVNRLVAMLDRSGHPPELPEGDKRRKIATLETVRKAFGDVPELREVFWPTFLNCVKINPQALPYVMMLMAMYRHLGPYSRYVIGKIDRRIEEIDRKAQADKRLRYQSSLLTRV